MALFHITAVFFSKRGFGEEKAVGLSLPRSDPEAPASPATSVGRGDRQHQHRGLGASLPGPTLQEVGAWVLPGDFGRVMEVEQSPAHPTRCGAPTLMPAARCHLCFCTHTQLGSGCCRWAQASYSSPSIPPLSRAPVWLSRSVQGQEDPYLPHSQLVMGAFLGRGYVMGKPVPCCMAGPQPCSCSSEGLCPLIPFL